ncbi:MAG: diversity-generating retroelement protein Avd [Thermodesulfobacteriota bacterium]
MAENKGPDSITLTYDLLKWSIPTLQKFPRDQRFLLGERIESNILDVLELLIQANYSKEKLEHLRQANLRIEVLRFLWRLSTDMTYLNRRRYEFVSARLNDIGSLIGGWMKKVKSRDEEVRLSL